MNGKRGLLGWQVSMSNFENLPPAQYGMEVLYNAHEIVNYGIKYLSDAKEKFDNCIDSSGPSALVSTKDMWNAVKALKDKGIKIRFITDVTKENISFCKSLMTISELRHLEGVKGNFGIVDSLHYGGAPRVEENQPPSPWIHSTVKSFIEQQHYFFDILWSKATPADQRIKEIEEGIKPEIIQTIQDPIETQKIGYDLIKSAKEEILIIFASSNTFRYEMQNVGILQLLREAAEIGATIRILTPIDEQIIEIDHQRLTGACRSNKVFIRPLEQSVRTKVSMLVADRKQSLTVELKDDPSNEATGLATYSNSKSTVTTYATIFEALWLQTEMYVKLKETENMQREFINVAAHELRTPIQPILGLSEAIRSKNEGNIKEYHELLDAIVRNAETLTRLTEDILDVARIESKSLKIRKEQTDLGKAIADIIQDTKKQVNYKNLKVHYRANNITRALVYADRNKLKQVVTNLINNAIKFTKKGSISINLKRIKSTNEIIVNVEDTGTGIDPEILPKLFTKFVTRSDSGGTGLGLYICKSIIEAHGGI
jgi:two-component system, OmpR family, sensor histidine kinase VicK